MTNKAKRVRKVIEKLGWMSFAGYAVTRPCGADKIASAASILTVDSRSKLTRVSRPKLTHPLVLQYS